MADNNITKYIAFSEDGLTLDPFNSKFRNLRQHVPVRRTVLVSDPFEANLPGLAGIHLNDVSLWWALLMFNDIVDPILDVVPGVKLDIPDREILLAYLQTTKFVDLSGNSGSNPNYTVVNI